MDQVGGITPAQMWAAVAGLAAVDAVLSALLTRWIRPPWPARLPGALLFTGALFFAALFAWAFRTYWSGCYDAVLPGWFRTFAPFLGAVIGAFGWGFWWVARKISDRWCVPLFLALGSCESIPGHLNAIYGRRLLEHCGPVIGVTPASALVFGLFEFGFYWMLILAVSRLVAGAAGSAESV